MKLKKEEAQALKEKTLNVLKNGGYIKGYSISHKRVMDNRHNPVHNLPVFIFDELLIESLIALSGLIFIYNEATQTIPTTGN